MELLAKWGVAGLDMALQTAPFLLLGLLAAGLIHVLVPRDFVLRSLGRSGMGGVVRAALVGVPLPVCSCGVVPLSAALRRKGASREATLSFLTTTPESSVDSILLTWGLLGPVMAVARPVAAFLTALLGGALSIAFGGDDRNPAAAPQECAAGACGCAAPAVGASPPAAPPGPPVHLAADDRAARRARQALAALAGRRSPDAPGLWRDLVRPALGHGFVELLDDLAFWLVAGVALAGAVAAMVPGDLASRGLGGGVAPMLTLLALGVPLYLCASGSTPVGAVLLAKGVSPGAALVFLLAGPATNVAALLMLRRLFGRRFVGIYLTSIAAGALASGLALDALLHALPGWLPAPVAVLARPEVAGWSLVEIASALLLAVLVGRSLARGALRRGLGEVRAILAAIGLRRRARGVATLPAAAPPEPFAESEASG